MDPVELYRRFFLAAPVLMGGVTGLPIPGGGAAERLDGTAAGRARGRKTNCQRPMAGLVENVWPACAALIERERHRRGAFATFVSTHRKPGQQRYDIHGYKREWDSHTWGSCC